MLIHLRIVYGCFHCTTAELNSCSRNHVVSRSKTLLSGPLQKWFAIHDVDGHLRGIPSKRLETQHPYPPSPSYQCARAGPGGLSFPSTYSLPCRISRYSEFCESSFSTPNAIISYFPNFINSQFSIFLRKLSSILSPRAQDKLNVSTYVPIMD